MASGFMGIEKQEAWNIDDTPLAAALDIMALRISPYDWGPFYRNPLTPVIESALPGLDRLKGTGGPELFICATRISDNRREVFRRPHIDRDVLLASAVRFPSVVGAARGPSGTTVYSTLMIQQPAQNKPCEAYVAKDTRLDIIYVEDAVSALIQLHDARKESLKGRVYNIAGIRIDGKAPQASDIESAVREEMKKRDVGITYKVNQQLSDTVRSFGVLDDSVAREDWRWIGESFGLQKAVMPSSVMLRNIRIASRPSNSTERLPTRRRSRTSLPDNISK
jgi:hypothetical protein